MNKWKDPDWDPFWDGPNHWPPRRLPQYAEFVSVVKKRFQMNNKQAESYIDNFFSKGESQANRDNIKIRVSDFCIAYSVYQVKKELGEIQRLMDEVVRNEPVALAVVKTKVVKTKPKVIKKPVKSFVGTPPKEVTEVGAIQTVDVVSKKKSFFSVSRKSQEIKVERPLDEIDKRNFRKLVGKYREQDEAENPDDDGNHSQALSEDKHTLSRSKLLEIRFRGTAIALARGEDIGCNALDAG